jgi:hypothetical protein
MHLWVMLGALKHWDVPHTLVEQKAGDLIVTAPRAMHQGWNSGGNVALAVNWGDGLTRLRIADNIDCSNDCVPSTTKDHHIVNFAWPTPADLRALYLLRLQQMQQVARATPPAEQMPQPTLSFCGVSLQPQDTNCRQEDCPGGRPSPAALEDLYGQGRVKDKALVSTAAMSTASSIVC